MIYVATIVITQAILVSWAALRPVFGVSYAFSNYAMICLGINALANPSNKQAFAIFNLFFTFTIFHDFLCWFAYLPRYSHFDHTELFMISISIVSTAIKPCQAAILWREAAKYGVNVSISSFNEMFKLDERAYHGDSGMTSKSSAPQNCGEYKSMSRKDANPLS
uniref:Uncharacterized protein n=1 Tax=Norrisiella sphaerica TaxID=552664 RepID=A0A7S2VVC0_9EUKA|mmetsp:Transcript_705/g.1037  ORF Transcript_705/g.1037 Transcript_705/m.1037 type:complete len:164 (+) Transcript_705:119-610(+)